MAWFPNRFSSACCRNQGNTKKMKKKIRVYRVGRSTNPFLSLEIR
jgi:hypothetical protein